MLLAVTTISTRRFVSALAIAALALSFLAVISQPAQAAEGDYRFEGNGWGHGVGLSQYGAQSRALAGQTAEEIVTTYYSGSELATETEVPSWRTPGEPWLPSWWTEDEMPLWVGLLEDDARFDFEADAGTLGLCHGLSDCPDATIGEPVPGQSWSFRNTAPNKCQFFLDETPMGVEDNCYARILLGADENTRIDIDQTGNLYAHGEIVVRPVDSSTFHVVVEIGIDDYVKGVDEAIFSWQSAALEAQALASRTFATFKALERGPASSFSASVITDCWCHVEDNSSDQVYDGWSTEIETLGENWVAAADATAGQYIVHPDEEWTESDTVLALFSSSNGGASESNGVAFDTAEQYTYLDTVPDPYSLLNNPQAPWNGGSQIKVAGTTVASKLSQLTRVDRIRVVERNPSGSAKTVLFEGKNGSTNASTTRTGLWTRSNMSLRSTFLDRVCRERGPYDDDGCSFFEHNIVNIYNAGFVGTLPGNDYDPEDDMTRSAMAAFLAAGLDLPATSTDYFPDDSSDPNHGAINALAEAGIVIGYPDGTYRPNNTVTRAEMAVYLARGLGVSLPSSVPDPFPDVPGDSWFGPAVAEILSRGITTGHQDGTYKPDQDTTREQMAAFMDRAFLGGF